MLDNNYRKIVSKENRIWVIDTICHLKQCLLIMCIVRFNTLLGKAIPDCWEFILVLNGLTMGILALATLICKNSKKYSQWTRRAAPCVTCCSGH